MKGIASTDAPKTLLGGWMGGWMGGKAGLRIAYSNQKCIVTNQIVGESGILMRLAIWSPDHSKI
jgi:hypothetical protein